MNTTLIKKFLPLAVTLSLMAGTALAQENPGQNAPPAAPGDQTAWQGMGYPGMQGGPWGGPGMGQQGMGPGMGQPGMGPGMGQPGMGPGMGQPGMGPGMGQPGMGPGMGQPGMGPGMGQPGMGPGMGQPGMGPGMMGRHHRGMEGGLWSEPADALNNRLESMKQQLVITAAQEPAWKAYVKAVSEQNEAKGAMRKEMSTTPPKDAVDMESRRIEGMERMLTHKKAVLTSYKALLAQLDEQQKGILGPAQTQPCNP
ncbi:MAG: Spy/CpxP family protein refolding chaperone [Magnetococcales bacterium]|nr:Spy/CpxP family protein refolding chaperone [Magnetococcales bacterium]